MVAVLLAPSMGTQGSRSYLLGTGPYPSPHPPGVRGTYQCLRQWRQCGLVKIAECYNYWLGFSHIIGCELLD